MNSALTTLSIASIAFVGSHFLLSHPLRAPLVKAIGQLAFLGLYSLVALVTLGWMVRAFKAAPAGDLPGSGTVGWVLASVLTLVALVLFLGSLVRNPAFPTPGALPAIPAEPHGAFRVTRHPMMWGIALWALAHIILFHSARTLILAAAIAFLALVGAHLQDRKKLKMLGEAWAEWEAETSYWPRLAALPGAGMRLWLGALAAWLAVTYAHYALAGVPAGIWPFVL